MLTAFPVIPDFRVELNEKAVIKLAVEAKFYRVSFGDLSATISKVSDKFQSYVNSRPRLRSYLARTMI